MYRDLDSPSTTATARPRMAVSAHRRPLAATVVIASMFIATSCSIPFSDGGEDLSAEVVVGSAEPSGSSKSSDTSRNGLDLDGAGGSDDPEDDESTEEPIPSDTTGQGADGDIAPLVQLDTRFNGRSVRYLGIDIELGDFITTNQSLKQYLGLLPPTDDDQVLLIEVAITNASSGTVSVPREVLGIRLPTGEWVGSIEMRETDGDNASTVRPATQATERVILEFPTTDLTGANFEISEASTIAESIPLDPDQAVAAPYTVDLAGQPAVAGLRSPSLWSGCDYAWTGQIMGGRITVEGVDGNRLERATKGQRWVAIELRATNDTTDGNDFYPCNTYGLGMSEISPRLQIDGIPGTSVNRVSSDRIEAGTATTVEFWFQIPVGTEEIELTDVGGTRIGIWILDLPRLPGEA